MNIIIIGASGYLGSSVHKSLYDLGNNISTIKYRPNDDSKFEAQIINIIKLTKPDVIINAGGSQNVKDDPEALRDLSFSNILLPAYLAWAINNIAPKCLLITFGSAWQYNNNNLQPYNAYAATKTAAEIMLDHYAQDGLRSASLSLCDTYGENDKRKKIVNLVVNTIKKDQTLNVSGGEQEIDLVHIDDVIQAIIQVINELKDYRNGCVLRYSICSQKPISIRQLVSIMIKIGNKDENFIENFNFGYYSYNKRERFSLKNNRQRPLKWRQKINLTDGLSRLFSNENKE
jgi:CDP-3, 6-dideoxy-D-glycero-L-glycero-4-hexulose-4-reductase